MKAIDVLKEAARRSGTPTTHIGPALGKAAPYVASTATRGSTPRADTLAAMLGVCGYELCAVPRGQAPDSAIAIDG